MYTIFSFIGVHLWSSIPEAPEPIKTYTYYTGGFCNNLIENICANNEVDKINSNFYIITVILCRNIHNNYVLCICHATEDIPQ